ncbi:MAG: response regulator [Kiritimatiellae bacterium]|nr:response regulator [Kiritimatiellia bacterium]
MAKILVIDDEELIRNYFRHLLRSLNYDVMVAPNSVDGCRLAADPSVNLIISDLNMEGELSDVDLIRELRRLRPDIPLVVISGYPTHERLQECEKLGVSEFITKPFELTFIASVLKRLLDEATADHS